MTDEERQRAMDFIVKQSAKNSVGIGRRARREMRERQKQFIDEVQVMKEFQAHSGRRLDALIDIVRADRNGRSS